MNFVASRDSVEVELRLISDRGRPRIGIRFGRLRAERPDAPPKSASFEVH
jgi:hypothetical protein